MYIIQEEILAQERKSTMQFKATSTPNPNAIKFTTDQAIFAGRIEITKESKPESLLLKHLMAIDGIDNLFCYNDFLTVCKLPSVEWNQLIPQIETVLGQITYSKSQ
ncbi:NifU N-terminal domain-containing protein [Sporolactobacillus laevolacticus]|uniref:Scaffold protein Nfu/NifU n=1 Tax=Sporolactobacillus laevolacticus DSM 442 TaxID=1395513 RepID=V6IZC8_9BACL|nr:Scaffold protein Nfu/NifU [Sporolactobacillus laevolacticus DSM 442]